MLKIYNNMSMEPLNLEVFKFPAGELHFKGSNLLTAEHGLHIKTDLCNSDEIMLLILIADTYRHLDKTLELLYTPYARQDRRTSHYEPFSLRAFARLINSCGFKRVTVYDPHSDVTPALIDNVRVIKRADLLPTPLARNIVIVSPDAGAMKANHEVAFKFNCQHISATKIRDVKTGDITGTQVHTDIDLKGRSLMILDDICDGGRTFIELAKVLKKHEPRRLHLHVTVGIFSKGIEVLEEDFDQITFNHKLGDNYEY